MKKIKITSKQYNIISMLYRIIGFIIVLGLLIGYSWLINKPIEFLLIFIPYFITKEFYTRQWHSNSLKHCFLLSIAIFALTTTIILKKSFSIILSFFVGIIISYLSYKAGDIQFKLEDYNFIEPKYNFLKSFYENNINKPFKVDTCSENELLEKCKQLHLNEENTMLAVEFFIKNTKHSILADKLCIQEKSITIRKSRLKKLLEK